MVTALARTMEKIHRDRGIAIDIDAPDEARFRGERQDLEEMVGNLVDNACKWAQSRVVDRGVPRAPDSAASAAFVRIVVDDDGPGLTPVAARAGGAARPPARRDQARLRARPLDRDRTRGALWRPLTLGTAPIGGLRAELVLPAA